MNDIQDTEGSVATEAVLDPDVRFLLANERTLLAWVRTALTVMAGGIALLHFGDTSVLQTTFGITVMLLGAVVAAMGYGRYRAADRAIRASRLPDIGHAPAMQVVGVILFALTVAVIELSNVL